MLACDWDDGELARGTRKGYSHSLVISDHERTKAVFFLLPPVLFLSFSAYYSCTWWESNQLGGFLQPQHTLAVHYNS